MFIKRKLSKRILEGAKQVPAIVITGPRQSGKSTLIKELFPHYHYLDMQDANLFDFASKDPKGFLESYANAHGIIIDEAQYVPELFPQIKVEADKNPKPGYFILSGSQNFLLYEKISESLAGRAYYYHLLPLSIEELKGAKLVEERPENQLLKGFYPRVYYPHVNAFEYYQNYIATYVERDIRMLRNIEDLIVFQKFMQLCALRIGSTINFNELAMGVGITVPTVKNWLSLLQTSFILFQLPSYHSNLGKRVIKSSKLFFYDVGLAASLMNIDKDRIVKDRTAYGALFENMIIVDVMKNLDLYKPAYTLSFFRESNNQEIDLIIEAAGKIVPIEIKASETLQASFFTTARWFQETVKSADPLVIYGGKQKQTRSYGKALSWLDTEDILS